MMSTRLRLLLTILFGIVLTAVEPIPARAQDNAGAAIVLHSVDSTPIFRERGRADYVTWLQSDAGQAGFAQLRSRLPH